MAPRPYVALGGYIQTYRRGHSRCKAYTAPPSAGGGQYICTLSQGTFIGPIEEVLETEQYTTICCRGYWVNIWCNRAMFCRIVPPAELEEWRAAGWQDTDAPLENVSAS